MSRSPSHSSSEAGPQLRFENLQGFALILLHCTDLAMRDAGPQLRFEKSGFALLLLLFAMCEGGHQLRF